MARIRTVKPEFWTSEQVMECDPMARLLFIGLWNFCDDGGVHPASVIRVKAEVFPGDGFSKDDVQGWINELIDNELIEEFEADGKAYWHVTGWDKHQRIDKKTFKHPQPQGADRVTAKKCENHVEEKFEEASESVRRPFDDSSRSVRPRNGREWKGMDIEIPVGRVLNSVTREMLSSPEQLATFHEQLAAADPARKGDLRRVLAKAYHARGAPKGNPVKIFVAAVRDRNFAMGSSEADDWAREAELQLRRDRSPPLGGDAGLCAAVTATFSDSELSEIDACESDF